MKDRRWYLAQRTDASSLGCALDVGPRMPHEEGFKPLPPVGAVLYKSLPTVVGITFYPEIRCRLGYPVLPKNWHAEREEPMLRCYLDNGVLTRDFTCFDDLAKWNRMYEERKNALRADGWEWPDPREGCERYIHVDELTKIEGPPPEGAF